MPFGNIDRSLDRLAKVGYLAIFWITMCVFVFFCSAASAQSTAIVTPTGTDTRIVDFERDIVPIFEDRCATCHQGDKAKGGFVVGDREAVLGYLEPGDTSSSSLWTDYLTATPMAQDPKSLVMPPSGPLPPSELAILRLWIDEGAVWPEGYLLANVKVALEPSEGADKLDSDNIFERAFGAIGYFHPAVIHFPIALLVFGGAAAGLSFFTGSRAQSIAFHCLLWGTIAAVLSATMGWSFATEKGFPRWDIIPDSDALADVQLLFRHRWMGVTVAVLSVVTLCIALVSKKLPTSSFRHVWKIGMLVLALLVSITGHQGGELVYGDILAKAVTRFVGK